MRLSLRLFLCLAFLLMGRTPLLFFTTSPRPLLVRGLLPSHNSSPDQSHPYILGRAAQSGVPEAIFILGHPFAMYLYRFIPLPWPALGAASHNFRNDQWYKWNSFASPRQFPLNWCSTVNRFAPSSTKSSGTFSVDVFDSFNVCNNKLNHISAFFFLSYPCWGWPNYYVFKRNYLSIDFTFFWRIYLQFVPKI